MPFPCSAAATSCGRGSGARGARVRGRVFRTRFRASSHARDAPRSLRSNLGKIENLRFRNFGSEIWAAFALPCPYLCSELAHWWYLQIFAEFTRKYRFLTSTQAGNGPRGHGVAQGASPRWSLPTQHPRYHQNLQNHENSSKIIKTANTVASRQQNPVLTGLMSWYATNDHQHISNYPRSNYRANGGV